MGRKKKSSTPIPKQSNPTSKRDEDSRMKVGTDAILGSEGNGKAATMEMTPVRDEAASPSTDAGRSEPSTPPSTGFVAMAAAAARKGQNSKNHCSKSPFPDLHDEDESVWVRFPNLPLQCWSDDSLSRLGSALGVPICTDACTSQQKRISYARILVEIDVTKPRAKEIWVQGANGIDFEQLVIYEWVPSFCDKCNKVGHNCVNKEIAPKAKTKTKRTKKMWVPKKQQQLVSKGPNNLDVQGESGHDHVSGANANAPGQQQQQETMVHKLCSSSSTTTQQQQHGQAGVQQHHLQAMGQQDSSSNAAAPKQQHQTKPQRAGKKQLQNSSNIQQHQQQKHGASSGTSQPKEAKNKGTLDPIKRAQEECTNPLFPP